MSTFTATRLENKRFNVIDDVFSDKVLTILKSYTKPLPVDKSSYDVWPAESTNNKTAVECFTCDIVGNDKAQILYELYENATLPCYKKTWLKHCDIAIHKMPVGSSIYKHADNCIFSLTVFLSTFDGGKFIWWEGDIAHIVEPALNKGIYAYYDNYTIGADHQVTDVESNTRYTLQLFLYPKNIAGTQRKDT